MTILCFYFSRWGKEKRKAIAEGKIVPHRTFPFLPYRKKKPKKSKEPKNLIYIHSKLKDMDMADEQKRMQSRGQDSIKVITKV